MIQNEIYDGETSFRLIQKEKWFHSGLTLYNVSPSNISFWKSLSDMSPFRLNATAQNISFIDYYRMQMVKKKRRHGHGPLWH